jgi:hypothetical protein
MAAPVQPPHVASGELITSAWGNGVVDSLWWATVSFGSGSMGPTPMVSGSTILHQAVPNVPYQTRMFVIANGWGGSDSGAGMDGVVLNVITQQAINFGTVQVPASPASRYMHQGITAQWLVPANTSPQFSLNVQWGSGTGTTYVAADLLWFQFRA